MSKSLRNNHLLKSQSVNRPKEKHIILIFGMHKIDIKSKLCSIIIIAITDNE